MVGAGKSTELWQPPMFKKDAVDKTRTPVLWCLKQLLCQLCHNIYPESLAMTVRILAEFSFIFFLAFRLSLSWTFQIKNDLVMTFRNRSP